MTDTIFTCRDVPEDINKVQNKTRTMSHTGTSHYLEERICGWAAGTRWGDHIIGLLAGGGEHAQPWARGLEFLPNGSCFWMWTGFQLFSHFSSILLSVASECLMLWQKLPVRWPPITSLFFDVSEGVVPCGCLTGNNSAFVLQLKFTAIYY